MLRPISLTAIVAVLLIAQRAESQTQELMLQKAYSYSSHSWVAESKNIWYPQLCGGKTVETPSWVGIGSNTAVPYCWGGYVSLSEFDRGLKDGLSAGDANTSSPAGAPSCATGVDCSGFVSQVWGSGRYTTSSFKNISYQLDSYQDLQPTDIVNKASSHVRMVYEINPNGSITMIEAATGNALVGGKGLYKVFTWTYSPQDLVGMASEGYVPRRYGQPSSVLENDDCANATVLYSSTSGEQTLSTVAGASASGLAISKCSGWASASALDVWFSFTAQYSTHSVTVTPLGDLDAVVGVYAGCSAGQFLTCVDISGGPGLVTPLTYDGFVAGQTYYIRVFDYGSESSQPSNGQFRISVTHTDPAPSCSDRYEPNNTTGTAARIELTGQQFSSGELCIGGTDQADVFFVDVPDGEHYLSITGGAVGIPCRITTGGKTAAYADKMLVNAVGGIYISFDGTGAAAQKYSFDVSLSDFGSIRDTLAADNGRYIVSGDTQASGYIRLEALPDAGYVFLHWLRDGKAVSSDSVYITESNAGTGIQAVFAPAAESVFVSVSAQGGCGTVTGGGYYRIGSLARIGASAGNGCRFGYFSIDGNIIGLNTEYSFSPDADIHITAHFSALVPEYLEQSSELSIYPNPADEYLYIRHRTVSAGTAWSIYSQKGECLLRGSLDNSETMIDLNALPAGMYIVKVDGHTQILSCIKR